MKITKLLPLVLLGLSFLFWPSGVGNSQKSVDTVYVDSSSLIDPEIVMLQHDIKKLREVEEKVYRSISKTRTKTVIKTRVIKQIPDTMSVYVRHPNGEVERITFNPNEKVPIIDLTSDTIYMKKVTLLKSLLSKEKRGWKVIDSTSSN